MANSGKDPHSVLFSSLHTQIIRERVKESEKRERKRVKLTADRVLFKQPVGPGCL